MSVPFCVSCHPWVYLQQYHIVPTSGAVCGHVARRAACVHACVRACVTRSKHCKNQTIFLSFFRCVLR